MSLVSPDLWSSWWPIDTEHKTHLHERSMRQACQALGRFVLCGGPSGLRSLTVALLSLRTAYLPLHPSPLPRTFDAFSTFYLNSSGLICRHHLDKVSVGPGLGGVEGRTSLCSSPASINLSPQLMPSHSPSTPVKKLLVGALVALGLSEPEPSLHLCSKA